MYSVEENELFVLFLFFLNITSTYILNALKYYLI